MRFRFGMPPLLALPESKRSGRRKSGDATWNPFFTPTLTLGYTILKMTPPPSTATLMHLSTLLLPVCLLLVLSPTALASRNLNARTSTSWSSLTILPPSPSRSNPSEVVRSRPLLVSKSGSFPSKPSRGKRESFSSGEQPCFSLPFADASYRKQAFVVSLFSATPPTFRQVGIC